MKFLDALQPGRTEVSRYIPPDWFGIDQRLPSGLPFQPAFTTTYGTDRAEPIGNTFADYIYGGYASNSVVWAVERVRMALFCEARFQFQSFNKGRPTNLFGTAALDILEHPWDGGTTGDLLVRMLVDADFAGNYFATIIDGELVRMRPDWVQTILEARHNRDGKQVGWKRKGYLYFEGGVQAGLPPAALLPEEVCHFAPYPDPLASWRGMSWITPIIREIMADGQTTKYKLKFLENSATPNLAVSLPKEISPADFQTFVDQMESKHGGTDNAGKTLYTGGGADVTIVGANMQQMDFKATQAAGETRIAAAAGIHPVIVGLTEGLHGASLNQGNFAAARRLVADGTLRPLWRNAAGSLEVLVPPPSNSRLWYDSRDVAFLREDAKDAALIAQVQAATIANLVREGFEPESAKAAVLTENMDLLVHSGLLSVQLQAPGTIAGAVPGSAPTDAGTETPPGDLQGGAGSTGTPKPGSKSIKPIPVTKTKSGKPDGRAGRDANSNGSVVGTGGHEQ